MWIQVRSMDGKNSCRIDGLSKLTKIEDLRKLLIDKFNAPVAQQRLFYRGKQLEDSHTLFDYNVVLNDIVQILVRPPDIDSKSVSSSKEVMDLEKVKNKENKSSQGNTSKSTKDSNENLSKYFKVGDIVDAKDSIHGAWFEAKIIDIKTVGSNEKNILQCLSKNDQSFSKGEINGLLENGLDENDGLIYNVKFEDDDDEEPVLLNLQSIRPRARKYIKFDDIKEGDFVMINYNIDDPKERGFWYDCKITNKKSEKQKLSGTVMMGPEKVKVKNCKIHFIDEIFAIEKRVSISEQNENANTELVTRPKMPKCKHCKDNPTRKCKICSCHICGGKDSPEKQILCDECDLAYHLWCLDPPLSEIPESDEWYCPSCKNDETEVVRAGEKLKASKKKSKMASASSTTSRDWGKGMACVGRTKECTIVPSNHFGPIPGVEVGTMWKFRVQVSESGVHRPHVAGIHGRENEGAYSIVLSGGYEDDLDDGEEFKYTGSGGRDLSGNKRCAEQSCDQTLTRMNKALAVNCNAPVNKNGAEADDWKSGKAVRVVRNYKGHKHSNYCPEEGNRYDGIYKIVKYWPEKGKSGYLVWRYLLRRDDPVPAPWTKKGKKRIKELGLTMQYPEGYLESLEEKEKSALDESVDKSSKRKREKSDDGTRQVKKKNVCNLPENVLKFIKDDEVNKNVWEECLEFTTEGSQKFLKKVEDCLSCICCQELVFQPISTECSHNICKKCLQRSFKAEVYNCPMCRQSLDKKCINNLNETLQKILLSLFPGYDVGR